jgi:DNA-binding NtrC family response regulator
MLTGVPDLNRAVELTRNGLFDYLTKPFQVEDFLHCLNRAKMRFNQRGADLTFADFVSRSAVMKKIHQLIVFAAENPGATVLLTGETGVGKDISARLIHQMTFANKSPMPPLICLNCPTLPAEMFEAELFGAEKGSYTGAHQQRNGLVEAANGGTLFLDEIAEVPFALQSKLLQFLETREYRRLGSTESRRFTGRIIAASNRNLQEEVSHGRFRMDLWYRLDVFSIHLPPLRERKEDLAELIDQLLAHLSKKYQRKKPIVKPDDYAVLERHDFPGNIRELRNLLERSLLQTPSESSWLQMDRAWLAKVRQAAPCAETAPPTIAGRNLSSIETQEYLLIQKALEEEKGAIRRAAAKLGLSHQALLRRLQKWPELRHPYEGTQAANEQGCGGE